MSLFVQSLKRLYQNNRVTISKLSKLKETKKITHDEYDYIVSAS